MGLTEFQRPKRPKRDSGIIATDSWDQELQPSCPVLSQVVIHSPELFKNYYFAYMQGFKIYNPYRCARIKNDSTL